MKTLKNQYTLFTKRIAMFSILMLFVAGCRKDFIVPDHAGIDNELLWNDAGAVNLFLTGTYWSIMPDFPYEVGAYLQQYASDENIGSATDGAMKKVLGIAGYLTTDDVKIIGNKYQNGSKGDNKYFEIARCNLGIHNTQAGSLPEAVKAPIIGQFYMLRAMGYFDIVRLYGGVPLVLNPQDPTNVDYSGRKSARQCFASILSDLDSANAKLAYNLPTANDWGRLGKLASVCFKGRVALTWASPQFNPINDALHPFEQDRWTKALEINRTAYDACVAAGLKLMPYTNLFITEGPANTEAIITKGYSNQHEKRFNGVEARSRPAGPLTNGAPSDVYVATQRMLDAYPMADGTPINAPGSGYDPDLYYLKRDPRFAATIAFNGAAWKLSGNANRKQWNYLAEIEGAGTPKPFYCKRFTEPNLAAAAVGIANDKGGGGLDWIELRFAEVLLNYAECLNETGDLTKSKELVRLLRTERGLVAGANDYGLSFANNKETMRDLILNERMVEFAFEGKRGWDLRRTRNLHKLSGGFLSVVGEQIYATGATTVLMKKTQLEEIITGTLTRRRDTLQIDKKSSYRYFFVRNLNFGNSVNAITVPEEQCYFYALPNKFMLSSPTLEQTKGWGNGTFDPLKN